MNISHNKNVDINISAHDAQNRKIGKSNKPCQCRSTDFWEDDTIGN